MPVPAGLLFPQLLGRGSHWKGWEATCSAFITVLVFGFLGFNTRMTQRRLWAGLDPFPAKFWPCHEENIWRWTTQMTHDHTHCHESPHFFQGLESHQPRPWALQWFQPSAAHIKAQSPVAFSEIHKPYVHPEHKGDLNARHTRPAAQSSSVCSCPICREVCMCQTHQSSKKPGRAETSGTRPV